MINFKIILLSLCSFVMVFGANTIQWQTTRNGASTGACRLESNKINVTLHPYYLDIEEEAVIATEGSVWWGDSNTLEIFGEFTMTPGTAIRSMLLWNGNTILKAKLRDKKAADSLYEAIVDRSKPVIVARDPSIIEQIGENRYRFRIYPVAINASRRLRILYSVPLQACSNGPAFAIHTAFSAGSETYPANVSVCIKKSKASEARHFLSYGSTKKELQYNVTYLIPTSNFRLAESYYYGYQNDTHEPSTLYICPDSSIYNQSFSYTISAGIAAGRYFAVFADLPDSVRAAIGRSNQASPVIEACVTAGTKTYITDVPVNGFLGTFIKSATAWDQAIHWTVYDSNGLIFYQYSQNMRPDTISSDCNKLPLFWASKYSLDQGNKGLGAIYGFVDSRMSLLALESDSLSCRTAQTLEDSGVPELLSSEIILCASQLPVPPSNEVMFEIQTAMENMPSDLLGINKLTVLPNGQIRLQLKDKNLTHAAISVFDLQGRLIARWNIDGIQNGNVSFKAPEKIRGIFLVRIKAGNQTFVGKAMFR